MARGLGSRGILLCSENKGADQLLGYLCFSHMQIVRFLATRLIYGAKQHSGDNALKNNTYCFFLEQGLQSIRHLMIVFVRLFDLETIKRKFLQFCEY